METGPLSTPLDISTAPRAFSVRARRDGGFRSNLLVAQLIDQLMSGVPGTADPRHSPASRALLARIQENPGLNLTEAYLALPDSQRAALRNGLGANLEELFSLSQERHPEMFFSSLLNFAQRQNHQGRPEAGLFLQLLADPNSEFASLVPASLRGRVASEWDAYRGAGSFGMRFENMSRNFTREVTHPGMLIGMGVAGTVFSGIRLAALSRLAASPVAFWTRGLAARGLASSIAFPAEVLSFWGTNRVYGQLTSPEMQGWDRTTISHELLGLSITLGLLKLGGAASQGLFDRAHGFNPLTGQAARLPALTRLTRPVFHQAGTFGGIALGHYAEIQLGLRPAQSTDSLLTDSLAMLVQFGVAGKLSSRLLGPRHASLMREMSLRTQSVGTDAARNPRDTLSWHALETALTPEGVRVPVLETGEPGRGARDLILQMTQNGDGEGTNPKPNILAGISSIEQVWDPAPTIQNLLKSLRTSTELPAEARAGIAAELYPHYEQVQRILSERLYAKSITPEEAQAISYNIKRYHFQTVSDEMLHWYERFRHLQTELLARRDQGTRRQRKALRRLLDSVNTKLLEIRRYHMDAESYLGDDKGPPKVKGPRSGGSSRRGESDKAGGTDQGESQTAQGPEAKRGRGGGHIFSDTNYPRLVRRFNDISRRLGQYIQEREPLSSILENHRVQLPSRYAATVSPAEIMVELAKLGLNPSLGRTFQEAMDSGDFLLTQRDNLPLAKLLREISTHTDPDAYLEVRRPLDRYLEALLKLRQHLSLEELTQMDLVAQEFVRGNEALQAESRLALQEVLGSKAVPEAERLISDYFEAFRGLEQQLSAYSPRSLEALLLEWKQVRAQFRRLGERRFLQAATVEKLLRWFEPRKRDAVNQVMTANRENALAGMVDFISKGTHTVEVRRELSKFFDQIVQRNDQRMMEVLSIHFQNYQLGMMRDRLQIEEHPTADGIGDRLAIESYDLFLGALLKTARFYKNYPGVRGPYFEIFDKVEAGIRNLNPEDGNPHLAAPILHRTEELLGEKYQVDLISRGGLGEAVLFANGRSTPRIIAITSILKPLSSRQDLETWLNRAERELLHNGEYQRMRNGQKNLGMSIYIPRIQPGVARDNISRWARDYLESHPDLVNIELYIPERGNEVADLFSRKFYKRVVVIREMATTERLISEKAASLASSPEDLRLRVELYRLRQDWIQWLIETGADRRPLKGEEELNRIQSEAQRIDGLMDQNWDLLLETLQMFPREKIIRFEYSQVLSQRYQEIRARGVHFISGVTQESPFEGSAADLGEKLSVLSQIIAECPDPAQFAIYVSNARRTEELRLRNHEVGLRGRTSAYLEMLKVAELLPSEGLNQRRGELEHLSALFRMNQHLLDDPEVSPSERHGVLTSLRAAADRIFPTDGASDPMHSWFFTQLEKINAPRFKPRESDLKGRIASFAEFTRMVMDAQLANRRSTDLLIDLGLVGAKILNSHWSYALNSGITIRGEIRSLGFEELLNKPSEPVSLNESEPENGFFSFTLKRDFVRGNFDLQFEHVFLPPWMRGRGIGRNFFGELVRLAEDLGIQRIVSPKISGEGRLKLALYGMQFKDHSELREMAKRFRFYLEHQIFIPEFEGFDLGAIGQIRNPQDFTNAHFNPKTRRLAIEPWTADMEDLARDFELPEHHFIGRRFLLDDVTPSFSGVFDVRPNSESQRILDRYFEEPLTTKSLTSTALPESGKGSTGPEE